eukprot:scaffold128824_cov22-Tisochrysis_lutea.AAC.1
MTGSILGGGSGKNEEGICHKIEHSFGRGNSCCRLALDDRVILGVGGGRQKKMKASQKGAEHLLSEDANGEDAKVYKESRASGNSGFKYQLNMDT